MVPVIPTGTKSPEEVDGDEETLVVEAIYFSIINIGSGFVRGN